MIAVAIIVAILIVGMATYITITGKPINAPNWKVWEWLSRVASATFEIRF